IDVFLRDINGIALNQLVVLNLNTEQDQTYEGAISKIYPSFDQVEQSFIAEATFVDKPDLLYHNTQLQANIVIGKRDGALVIPIGYLADGDSVKLSDGKVKSVQAGLRNDQWVEIIEGITPSDVLRKPNEL
ncbi:MAG: RND transporter, partial [Bacteroidota bacterium]